MKVTAIICSGAAYIAASKEILEAMTTEEKLEDWREYCFLLTGEYPDE